MVGLDKLIAGGDDYEILCTVPQAQLTDFTQAAGGAGVAVTKIGVIVAGTDAPRFVDAQGSEIVLTRRSYSHF